MGLFTLRKTVATDMPRKYPPCINFVCLCKSCPMFLRFALLVLVRTVKCVKDVKAERGNNTLIYINLYVGCVIIYHQSEISSILKNSTQYSSCNYCLLY